MIQITPKGEAPQAPAQGSTPQNPLTKVMNTLPPGQPDTNVGQQGSEPTTEAPAPAQADPLSPKFARLAMQEKAIRSREAAVKAKEEALKAKESEYSTGYIPKSGLKEAAMAALKSGELSYDEFTQMMLASPAAEVDPVIRDQQAKIAALEKKLEELDSGFKTKQTTEYQQAVTQLGHDVKSFVTGNADFEAIDKLGMHQKVVDLITATFNDPNDGRLLSIDEAAKEIEGYLLEEAERVFSIDKVKSKFAPPTPVEANPAQKQPQTQQQPMKTLTNAVTTSKPMTPRERAMAAFRGELN